MGHSEPQVPHIYDAIFKKVRWISWLLRPLRSHRWLYLFLVNKINLCESWDLCDLRDPICITIYVLKTKLRISESFRTFGNSLISLYIFTKKLTWIQGLSRPSGRHIWLYILNIKGNLETFETFQAIGTPYISLYIFSKHLFESRDFREHRELIYVSAHLSK